MKKLEVNLPETVYEWICWLSKIRKQPADKIIADWLVLMERIHQSAYLDAEEVTGSQIIIGKLPEEKPNLYFEICKREHDHPYHTEPCPRSKLCPDFEECSKGEFIGI